MISIVNMADALSLRINRIVANLVGGVVILMFASLFLQVCCRYFFNAPLPWPEEFTMFLMAWMSFLGASVALRNWGHIGIDFVLDRLNGRPRLLLLAVIRLCVLVFCVALLLEGVNLTLESAGMVSDGMRVSMVYPRLSMPVGAALMTLHALAMLLADCKNLFFGS